MKAITPSHLPCLIIYPFLLLPPLWHAFSLRQPVRCHIPGQHALLYLPPMSSRIILAGPACPVFLRQRFPVPPNEGIDVAVVLKSSTRRSRCSKPAVKQYRPQQGVVALSPGRTGSGRGLQPFVQDKAARSRGLQPRQEAVRDQQPQAVQSHTHRHLSGSTCPSGNVKCAMASLCRAVHRPDCTCGRASVNC